MKICTKCKVEKSLNEFYKDSREKDGFDYKCKSCEKKRYRLRAEQKGVKAAIRPIIKEHGKQCTRCNEFKSYNEFSNHPQNKTGKHPRCNSCRSEVRIENRLKRNGGKPLVPSLTKKGQEERRLLFEKGLKVCNDCNKIKSISAFYKTTRLDSADGFFTHCKDCNKSMSNKYRETHRDEVLRKAKEFRKKNPGYNTERSVAWANKKKQSDPLFRLTINLRSMSGKIFKRNGYKKNSKTAELLGCSFETVKQHLESQFTDGMTWDNYGAWHIDHMVPLAVADTVSDLHILSYYKNLQPLWAEDNLKKGGSWE